jgi:hypothetical protein
LTQVEEHVETEERKTYRKTGRKIKRDSGEGEKEYIDKEEKNNRKRQKIERPSIEEIKRQSKNTKT